MQRRKLEELNLLDDFLFNAMLAYPDTGEAFIRKLLETLFDRKFPHLKIRAQESFAGVEYRIFAAQGWTSILRRTEACRSMERKFQRSTMWNRIITIKRRRSKHFQSEPGFIMR